MLMNVDMEKIALQEVIQSDVLFTSLAKKKRMAKNNPLISTISTRVNHTNITDWLTEITKYFLQEKASGKESNSVVTL